MSDYVLGFFVFDQQLTFEKQEVVGKHLMFEAFEAGYGLLLGATLDEWAAMYVLQQPAVSIWPDRLAFQLTESLLIGASGGDVAMHSNKDDDEIQVMLERLEDVFRRFLDAPNVQALDIVFTNGDPPEHPAEPISLQGFQGAISRAVESNGGYGLLTPLRLYLVR